MRARKKRGIVMPQYNITHTRFTNVPTNQAEALRAAPSPQGFTSKLSSAPAPFITVASRIALCDLGVELLLLLWRQ